eukprot:13941124-Heterocapsa_arctica.AAC.1
MKEENQNTTNHTVSGMLESSTKTGPHSHSRNTCFRKTLVIFAKEQRNKFTLMDLPIKLELATTGESGHLTKRVSMNMVHSKEIYRARTEQKSEH